MWRQPPRLSAKRSEAFWKSRAGGAPLLASFARSGTVGSAQRKKFLRQPSNHPQPPPPMPRQHPPAHPQQIPSLLVAFALVTASSLRRRDRKQHKTFSRVPAQQHRRRNQIPRVHRNHISRE